MPPDKDIVRSPRHKGKGIEVISAKDSRRAYRAGRLAGEDFACREPHADASRAEDYGFACAYNYAGYDEVTRGYFLTGFIAGWQREAIH